MLKLCIVYGASLVQLLVKRNFDPVMSGHGAMTSQEVQGQTIFARNSGIWHITGLCSDRNHTKALNTHRIMYTMTS